jgi:hypothetical protein
MTQAFSSPNADTNPREAGGRRDVTNGGRPDMASLPRRVNRPMAAYLVTQFYFPISRRTLEVWPLAWRIVNGKAVCETAELFDIAEAKLNAAPPIRGGRGGNQQEAA